MPYRHKKPCYRVIFFRKKEIVTFTWANQYAFGLARSFADELAMTLGSEWTVEVLDTHNRPDTFYAVAYETRGYKEG